jgi:hypothetical protein
MTYIRVLPRDLFNEAKLLKCMGKLTLLIHDGKLPKLNVEFDDQPFDIVQNPADGSISVNNITVTIKNLNGMDLHTPLNSKANWPLYAIIGDKVYSVFTEEGELDEEFTALFESVHDMHYRRLNDYRNSAEYFEYAQALGMDAKPSTRKLIGERWEINEELYNDFLDMLPPMGWRNGAFYMCEYSFDNITAKFSKEGDKFYCEFARYGTGA